MSGRPLAPNVPPRAIINARIYPMGPPHWTPGGALGSRQSEGPRRTASLSGGRTEVQAGSQAAAQPWEATAEAMLWEGDTILAIGTQTEVLRDARAVKATVEDLSGRIVFPGFVDAHMHFIHAGLKGKRPDLRGAKSLGECMARLATWLKANPGTDAVTGEGWDESEWEIRRRPTRDDLDAACVEAGQPDRPVVLRRIDGHIAVANSAALPIVRKRWDDDAVVDMQTGILLEDASLYLNEALPAAAKLLDDALQLSCRIAHGLGVTALGDYAQAPFRLALQRAAARGKLSVRVASSIYVQQLDQEIAAGFRTGRRGLGVKDDEATSQTVGGTSPFLKDGGLKVFLDGSLGAHTAALREGYLDVTGGHGAPGEGHGHGGGQSGKGKLNWSDQEVDRLFMRAHDAGIQVHAHAIGDAAIDQGLGAFAKVAARADLEGEGWNGNALRHRFEHYEIVHDDQLARTAELGIVSSSQPNFVGEWSSKGGMYEARLGERFRLNNRFQSMKRAGVRIAFGSDGMPFGPLVGIQAAVDHPDPAERMDSLEAVWHYTWMAAWSLHWEGQIGSLEVGKKADFAVLEETDLEGPPRAWRIRETVVGGVTRHPRG